jgi:hypothetical protein
MRASVGYRKTCTGHYLLALLIRDIPLAGFVTFSRSTSSDADVRI